MLCVPVEHCVSACVQYMPGAVPNVRIFDNQSEWMLTKRAEQHLEIIPQCQELSPDPGCQDPGVSRGQSGWLGYGGALKGLGAAPVFDCEKPSSVLQQAVQLYCVHCLNISHCCAPCLCVHALECWHSPGGSHWVHRVTLTKLFFFLF